MLFISRADLEAVKLALSNAQERLRTHDNHKPMVAAYDDAIEAVALMALGAVVSADTGRADSVHPSDVHYMSKMQPFFTPPKLD